MPALLLIPVIFVLAWTLNFIDLTNCDFESPYKCEAIHAAGLIPVFSLVTVWFDTDSGVTQVTNKTGANQ